MTRAIELPPKTVMRTLRIIVLMVEDVADGVAGLLGADQRPRFREYVVREHIPSYRLHEAVTVGMVLPPKSIAFYAIPREFGVPQNIATRWSTTR